MLTTILYTHKILFFCTFATIILFIYNNIQTFLADSFNTLDIKLAF